MDRGTVWQHIDVQRAELADLIDAIDAADPGCWDTPSLCSGWSVRNVAAHLTHSTIPMPRMLAQAARNGFRFGAVVDRMARQDRRTPAELAGYLRGIVGCRRHPPGTSALEPLIDVLVHAQDICVPLGIERPMPADAAVAAAERVWTNGLPFQRPRRPAGTRLVAIDADFAVGDGPEVVSAPIRDLLMLLTGRPADVNAAG